jgi:predicted GTPase
MDVKNNTCCSLEAFDEIKPDMAKLRAYSQTKLALAGQLRIVREALKTLGREDAERQCEELIVKLAEDRFTLAVLGQFKRGKSSLMNAIIGRELIPTGVLPLTSAITVLKYGPVERLIIRRQDWSYPDELPVSALAEYVTEQGNPSNVKKVKTACVELPVPFLRRGLEFVDTPGVGSAITANTATTYEFLPECDAVLFVTSVDTPLTSMELAFLKDICEYVGRLFFVVNKTDLVADNERSEILRFVADTIRAHTGSDAVRVFPVSARQGLAARVSGNAALYERSGIRTLEEALAAFLSDEKTTAFLAAVAQKAMRILTDEAAKDAFGDTALKARTEILKRDKSATAMLRDPLAAATALGEARTRIEALYAGIKGGLTTETAGGVPQDAEPQPGGILSNDFAPSSKEPDMAAGMRTRGCPVCRHITKSISDFFANWQYRLSIEERAQAGFAAELGFCPLHTWQLVAMSSPHGASVGYAQLADQVARRLRENSGENGEVVKRLVHDSRNCRVCNMIRKVEEEYIRQLAELIGEAAGRKQYGNSQGACLRHLGMLLDAAPTEEIREYLLSYAARRFEEDAEDMRSFAMKHEAVRRALQNRDEEDAYRRAVVRIVGDRSVCVPWAEDGEI